MITATGMRAEARKHLTGKWNRGALIALCYFIVELILELIGNGLKNNNALYLAYQIIFFIVSVPISYGFIYNSTSIYCSFIFCKYYNIKNFRSKNYDRKSPN